MCLLARKWFQTSFEAEEIIDGRLQSVKVKDKMEDVKVYMVVNLDIKDKDTYLKYEKFSHAEKARRRILNF